MKPITVNEDLELITMEELDLPETLETLYNGETVLLTSYENNKSKDLLVRMHEQKGNLITQVAEPTSTMGGFVGSSRYWSLYDVSINMLSLYPTYRYDSTHYNIGNKFESNSTVSFQSTYGDTDIAIVQDVFMDADNNFYYTLSGEGEHIFEEEELTEV